MPSLHPYNLPGQWYKGNLHCHTTESDGIRSPVEVMDWYAKHGYAFISMTDHNRLTMPDGLGKPSLLAIPGTELTCRRNNQEYHVIGIGVAEMPIDAQHDPQETIDAINTAGGISFVAHPYWHNLQLDDLIDLRGHIGIEIYNTGCCMEVQRGHSLVHWDGLTSRGQRLWGLAVDDAHWITLDYGGGWIVAKTDHFDQGGILGALRSGNFYSSAGPEIHDICVDGDLLKVTCSPARSIYVFDQYHYSPLSINTWGNEIPEEGCSAFLETIQSQKPITEAEFKLDPRQEILRIEVIDLLGRSAWSNPFFKNHAQQTWE